MFFLPKYNMSSQTSFSTPSTPPSSHPLFPIQPSLLSTSPLISVLLEQHNPFLPINTAPFFRCKLQILVGVRKGLEDLNPLTWAMTPAKGYTNKVHIYPHSVIIKSPACAQTTFRAPACCAAALPPPVRPPC